MRSGILNLVLAVMPIAACVANEPTDPDVCPPNKTLVCETRMGHTQDCTCRNPAEMRDVFDLSGSR